jgi:hypothetical protein
MNTAVRKEVLSVIINSVKGTTFLGVRNYENSKGEVSNYVLLVGISYENLLKKDFQALKDNQHNIFESKELSSKFGADLIKKSYQNLYDSLEKRLSDEQKKQELREQGDKTIRLSDAQSDAYTTIDKGMRLHNDTNKIQIFGLVIGKKVIKKGEYKEVNSRQMTICQNMIKKICGFKQAKFRTFEFDQTEIKAKGITL